MRKPECISNRVSWNVWSRKSRTVLHMVIKELQLFWTSWPSKSELLDCICETILATYERYIGIELVKWRVHCWSTNKKTPRNQSQMGLFGWHVLLQEAQKRKWVKPGTYNIPNLQKWCSINVKECERIQVVEKFCLLLELHIWVA